MLVASERRFQPVIDPKLTISTLLQFISTTNWQLAMQASFAVTMSDLFSVIPTIGDAIGDSIGFIFAGYNIAGQFDFWASNVEWGMRMCMGGAGTLGFLGPAWTLLTTFIPSLPSNVGSCFSIGGPMSGSGLPIKVSMTAMSKTMSMYFCSKDSQCPG